MTTDAPDPDDRFERITHKQRECLLLVASGHQIKEIADVLGIKPDTVKERLRAAREIIGVNWSAPAARLYLQWEASRLPSPAILPPTGLHPTYPKEVEARKSLAIEPDRPPIEVAANDAAGSGPIPSTGSVLRERQAFYDVDSRPREQTIWRMLGLPLGRKANDLDRTSRLIVIAVLTVMLGILFWGGSALFILMNRALIDINDHGG